MEQSQVEDIVAHELAHLILESGKKRVSQSVVDTWPGGVSDHAADKLIEQWGFNASYKKAEVKP